MSATRIALAGIGKIARDEHVPALTASGDFELMAAVTRHTPPDGVPAFTSIAQMKDALPDVSAISICTPPSGRLQVIQQAFDHGLDVMIEKPPAATLGEARQFAGLAARAGRVLYVTWHSRAAAAVEPARRWLQGRTIRAVKVTWKEDVRVWHPGQSWIWEPGIGVFDPGVNAFSVITRILPGPLVVAESALRYPANKDAPIAASITMTNQEGLPVSIELDFDQRGPQTWDIDVHTDAGLLKLSMGASRMAVDGRPLELPAAAEYPGLYRRFAELLESRRSDVDLAPFVLVADSYLLGRRTTVEPFDDF